MKSNVFAKLFFSKPCSSLEVNIEVIEITTADKTKGIAGNDINCIKY